MKIILLTDSLDGAGALAAAARSAECYVIKHIGPDDEVNRYVEKLRPDALVVVSNEMDREVLRDLRAVKEKYPLPVLVFTRDDDPEAINLAMKAGASSYVIDCYDLTRLRPLLEVARSRFLEQQRLEDELDNTQQALSDRKVIDKAKGLIMKQRGMSEDEAYKALRKLAMDKNKKIGEVAEQLVLAAEMLI